MNVIVCTQMFPEDGNHSAIISGMIKNPFNQTVAVSEHLESVEVLTTSKRKFTKKQGNISVTGVGDAPLKGVVRSTIYEAKILWALIRLSRKRKYDIVHIHHLSIPLIFLCRLVGLVNCKVIYTAHGTSTPELNAARQGSLLNHGLLKLNGYAQHLIDLLCWKLADLVLVPSKFQLKEMVDLYRVPRNKIKVVYNGYNQEIYYPDNSKRLKKRNDLGVNDDFVILYVGRAAKKKGVIELIETCDKLASEHKAIKLVLVVGFMGRQQEYRSAIVEAASSREYVQLFESVPELELPYFYNCADLCVFPSIGYESLPTVIFEAVACGKRVITQGAWGIPEAIDGTFISEDKILKRAFDGELNGVIQDSSRNGVELGTDFDKFSWQKGAKALFDIYSQIRA